MTTTVVAYTSFCEGHVTRFSSFLTSLRNRRMRSMRPPVASLTVSNRPGSSATFVLTLLPQPAEPKLRSPVRLRASRYGATAFAWTAERRLVQARRESNPQPPVLETGALPIELLAFIDSGAAPPDPSRAHSRGPQRYPL